MTFDFVSYSHFQMFLRLYSRLILSSTAAGALFGSVTGYQGYKKDAVQQNLPYYVGAGMASGAIVGGSIGLFPPLVLLGKINCDTIVTKNDENMTFSTTYSWKRQYK